MDARGQQWTLNVRRGGWSTWCGPTLAGSASPSATRWGTPPGAPTVSSQPRLGSWKRGNLTPSPSPPPSPLSLPLFFCLNCKFQKCQRVKMLSSSVSPDQTGSNSRVSQIPQLDNTPVWAPIIGTLFWSRRIIRSSSWQRHKLVLAISRPPGGFEQAAGGEPLGDHHTRVVLPCTQGLGYHYTHPGG